MKLKFALFEPNINELKKIQAFFLSNQYDIELYRASNIETASEILKEQEHFDFIYMNVQMSTDKKNNDNFIHTILSNFSQSNFMFLYQSDIHKKISSKISQYEENLAFDGWMKLPFKPIQFAESLEKMIPNLSEFERSDCTGEYVSLKVVELQQLEKAPTDIYISLSAQRYIKIINQSEELESAFFKKYKSKGVDAFHIKKEEFHKNFDQFFTSPLLSPLLSKKAFQNEEEYIISSQRALSNIIAEFGVSDDVVSTATLLADEAVTILEKNNLSVIISLLQNSKNTFIYDHSFLLSLICLETAKKFNWYSSKHSRIICLGSMLHDAALTDPKFNDVEIEGHDKMLALSEDDQKLYHTHPLKIANQLKHIMDIPSDVLGIILKHHEGFGPERSFPHGHYSSQLSAIECLFVMSHEVVSLFYRNKFDIHKIESELASFWGSLHTENFRKYVKELEEVVGKIIESLKVNN